MTINPLAARFDATRSLAFGAIGATYTTLGTPLVHLTRIIKLVNTTNADVQVSFDGVTDNDYIPAGGFSLYDLWSDGLSTSPSTQVFVKYVSAPGSGSFILTCIYAKGQ